jgi:hypothetical protein
MFNNQDIKLEMELEMTKILYTFIIANAHYFSEPVMQAVRKLMLEVEKMENCKKVI